MANDEMTNDQGTGRAFSRRGCLGLGLGTLLGWLIGCQRAEDLTSPGATVPLPSPSASALPPTASPTSTSLPSTSTPTPTPALVPTLPPTSTNEANATLDRATLMARWPTTATSRVVVVRHDGVWVGDEPDLDVVRQMLDAGLSTLTGVADVERVWRALFEPGERVLLKVNCIAYNGPTQPVVTYAVARRLQAAGLASRDVLIFDRTDDELVSAGYALNEEEKGGDGNIVQCHGARGTGSEAPLTQATVHFYRELDACDAIVNLPTPKQHGSAGVSVSLKNHYGSVDRPGRLHGDWCDPAIAELNAQPTIRDKTRLIVGAALNVSPCDWNQPERENALLLAFDPVALDTVARDILVRHREALGLDAGYLVERSRHLGTAQSLQIGATDAALIDLQEVTL